MYFNATEVRIDHGKLSIVQTTPQEVGYEPVFIVRYIQTGNFKRGDFLKNNIVNIVSRKYHNQESPSNVIIKRENIWMLEIASPSHMTKEEPATITDAKGIKRVKQAHGRAVNNLRKYSVTEEAKMRSGPGVIGRFLMSVHDKDVDNIDHYGSWFTTKFSTELKNQIIGFTSWEQNVSLDIKSVPWLLADNVEGDDPDMGMADVLLKCLESWKPFLEDCDLSYQDMFQVVSSVDAQVTSTAFKESLSRQCRERKKSGKIGCLVNARGLVGDPRLAIHQLLDKCRMISMSSPAVAHVISNNSCSACDVQMSQPFTIMQSDAVIKLYGCPLHKLFSSVMSAKSAKKKFVYPITLKSFDRKRYYRGEQDAQTATSTQIGEKRKAPDDETSLQSQMARGILAQDAAPAPTLLEGQGTYNDYMPRYKKHNVNLLHLIFLLIGCPS